MIDPERLTSSASERVGGGGIPFAGFTDGLSRSSQVRGKDRGVSKMDRFKVRWLGGKWNFRRGDGTELELWAFSRNRLVAEVTRALEGQQAVVEVCGRRGEFLFLILCSDTDAPRLRFTPLGDVAGVPHLQSTTRQSTTESREALPTA